MAPFKQL